MNRKHDIVGINYSDLTPEAQSKLIEDINPSSPEEREEIISFFQFTPVVSLDLENLEEELEEFIDK